ncbi:MAG: HD domain-containing protein [Clostridiales bacterium]|nr:HD domain-containing protein [Candidatus Equinaster intestinalis]
MNFTELDKRGTVEGFGIVKSATRKTSSKGDAYLDMTLADSSGEINAKLWNYNELMHGIYETNMLVKVRGMVSEYNGADQLRIDRIRRVNEEDNVNIADFVKSADYSGEKMFDELKSIAEGFTDKELSRLVTYILDDKKEQLLYWPAAFKLHHAIRGGLLLHTLSIVKLAEGVCSIYPFIDRDLLLAGAILHDIAKLTEYNAGETGIASGYTAKGNLIGHLAEGAMTVRKASETLGISSETSMLLEHMLLSHHGEPDFGAAVRPMFIEAEVLSELDMMDARIYEMKDEILKKTDSEGFTDRMWSMDNRKLFDHKRVDLNKKTQLF